MISMAGIPNKSFNYLNDEEEEEEGEDEQIYDSIDEDSTGSSVAFSVNKESSDKIDLTTETLSSETGINTSYRSSKIHSVQSDDVGDGIPEKLPIKQRRSFTSLKGNSYDEVTINFGKPVLVPPPNSSSKNNGSENHTGGDIFDSVCFTSPIEDVNKDVFRYPSIERSSSQLSDGNETSSSFYYEHSKAFKKTLSSGQDTAPPVPTPRTSIVRSVSQTQYDNVEIVATKQERASTSTSESDYCDNGKGRYEDIECINYESDENDSNNTKDDIIENVSNVEKHKNKTVILHPEYSDVRDFAFSLVNENTDKDDPIHKYTDITIVPKATPTNVEVENILNISHGHSDDKEDGFLTKYSRPLDQLPSPNIINTLHENIYTEIEASQGDERTKCDTTEHVSLIDMPTDEQDEEDDILCQLGARPRIKPRTALHVKSSTIDIRNEIAQWYDEASREVERDMSLDLDVLENVGTNNASTAQVSDSDSDESPSDQKEPNHTYEHVALQDPGSKCQLVDGKLVIQPKKPTVTLLRDFDPLLHGKNKQRTKDVNERDETSDDDDMEVYGNESIHCSLPNEVDGAGALPTTEDKAPKSEKDEKKKDNEPLRSENIYSDSPIFHRKDHRSIIDRDIVDSSDRDSFDDRLDLPPPLSPPPPPPLPESQPPIIPRRLPQYENVWLGSEASNSITIKSASSPSSSSSSRVESSSPVPVKPPRPSIHRATIDHSTPKDEGCMNHQKMYTADSFSSEDGDIQEEQDRHPEALRQNSTTSATSRATQHSNKGKLYLSKEGHLGEKRILKKHINKDTLSDIFFTSFIRFRNICKIFSFITTFHYSNYRGRIEIL